MMSSIKALIIKEYSIGESDKIITLFSKELGKIQVIAPYAKKYQRGFASSTELFVYGEFTITKRKDTYRLIQVEVIESFHAIRKDLKTLSYASYVMEFLLEVTREATQQEDLLRLALKTLQVMAKGREDLSLIRFVFEMRSLSMLGFMPRLDSCSFCNDSITKQDTYYFCCALGGIICKECMPKEKEIIMIHENTYFTLQYIIHIPIHQLYQFQVTIDVLKELEKVSKAYVAYYLEKTFHTAVFIETMEMT